MNKEIKEQMELRTSLEEKITGIRNKIEAEKRQMTDEEVRQVEHTELQLRSINRSIAAAIQREQLRALNDERKVMTQRGTEEALRQVGERYADDRVLVVFLPDCHESVAGIIAGRVREAFHKPSFVLTRSEDGVKGSGRSIEAYHMYRGLCGVRDLLLKFGGHPMAAGFSMEERNVDEFRRRLNEQADLKPEDFVPKVWIDVAMPLEYISEALVEELKLLEPFGQGNEKPQFAQKNLTVRNARSLGKNNNAVRLSLVTEQGYAMDAMVFTEADAFLEEIREHPVIDAVYYPEIHEYNGSRTLQIVVREYKLSH